MHKLFLVDDLNRFNQIGNRVEMDTGMFFVVAGEDSNFRCTSTKDGKPYEALCTKLHEEKSSAYKSSCYEEGTGLNADSYESNREIFNVEKIAVIIHDANFEEADQEINRFFNKLIADQHGINSVKIYCIELLMAIIRQYGAEKLERYIGKLTELRRINSTEDIQGFIKEAVQNLAKCSTNEIHEGYCKLVKTIIKLVHDNLGNENLSLKWLANQVLYMNEGYLSKLFSRETGEKFSHYLMRLRMEKARDIILEADDNRICEIANKVGLGDNPQYFSRLFKKYTGFTPSEYKKQFFAQI